MPAWSALAWFEQAWQPGSWALVAPPPPPPPPPSGLPLPAKLLGRAPKHGKKKERPNVQFRPAKEEVEEQRQEDPQVVEPQVEIQLPEVPITAPFSLGLPPEPVVAISLAPAPQGIPVVVLPLAPVEPAPLPVEAIPEATVAEPVPEPTPPTAAAQLIELANRVAEERAESVALRDAVPALRQALDDLRANRDAEMQRQRDALADKVAGGLTALAGLVTAGARASTVRSALRVIAADIGRPDAVPPETPEVEVENQRRRAAADLLLRQFDDE